MNVIKVLGLGAGDLEQLPMGVYKQLMKAEHLFLRTKEHPVIAELEKEGLTYQSFDAIYEQEGTFGTVYERIAEELITLSEQQEIVYAVPGHPLVAEKTVQILLDKEKEGIIKLDIKGGQSFLDPMFTAVGLDPIDGFQFHDATALVKEAIQPTQAMIFCQVYDAFIASEVKLTLMEMLPDDYPVTIVTAAGSSMEQITEVPLYELDRVAEINNLTSVYVPAVTEEELLYKQFSSFRKTIATLRGPGGCPWDQKQTHESLKKYLIEEAYELLDAIDEEDTDGIIEELGDVLLQVMLHAQIGEDEGYFSIEDVIEGINEKMIRRHPHVFADTSVEDAEDVVTNWEAIKAEEKGERAEQSILDSVAKGLPNLTKAYQYQKKAGKVGFDWDDVEPMWEKVKEEIQELQEELAQDATSDRVAAEYGDVLFAFVNIARYYKIDPEEAVALTNRKFYRRFTFIEKKVKELGQPFENLSLEQLDAIWEEAKKKGL
ncbi:nucleoside triphosphate pyrophosphohydrolase [Sutcliffiella horikoshii]|uniref:nucleoside triphosphate pyrophosphohydrolase n=1 Tax=Sutcliffiella horikoshii TaxID=79883 RepID=UPI001F3D936D|nr:nucleoside triphosphate pyrophosphohydrolase [Sutcliffiella horikoshii]MCG1023945.1 nucleoside triphosphate pyrophosphohydrolase [Sutcliffiella horikoshii]